MQKIIICPNDTKLKILKEDKTSTLTNQKFMTKQEFLNHYYGEYDERAIYYLMKKYNYHIDVAKVYLKNLLFIEEKDYKTNKMNFLKDLKNEMKPFLIQHPTFKNYIKNKEIEVINTYDLDPIVEDILSNHIEIPKVSLNNKVYEFSSLEKEVSFVCQEIRKLIEKGISLNKIFLMNVGEDYFYTLDKMFSYYNIPIMIPYKNSIYSTKVVKDYLESNILPDKEDEISSKLRNILGDLSILEEDEIKKEILIDKLKNTYLSNVLLEEAVTIKNIKDRTFEEDEYVFLLGFNQDSMPSIEKDIDYLSDLEKKELNLYTSKDKNILERKVIPYLISNIKNLTITYKLTSPFQKYYPSSFIKDYNLEVIKGDELEKNYEYSNMYNKIRLGKYMDNFYIYKEKPEDLILLNSNYDIKYKSYDNKYSNINKDTYLENLKVPLKLSYTSLNTYNECPFKYYMNKVLSLNPYEDKFSAYIGSLYHHILENYQKEGFDFETEWNKYLEKREVTPKEKILLIRIKRDLLKFLEVLKKQKTYTLYKDEIHEKEVTIPLRQDIQVELTGKIDKIMAYHNLSDTYYSIVDYKSGTIDTHLETMKYGLHMQLPIYLYLLNDGKVFDNPIFTGIYYQNILFNRDSWDKDLEKKEKKKYDLQGYSIEDIDILKRFDETYKDSEFIRSMSYTDDKGFNKNAKIMTNERFENLLKYTKKIVKDNTEEILNRDFKIHPIFIEKKEDACKFCNFKDVCFKTNDDTNIKDKVEDLDFLGGDE